MLQINTILRFFFSCLFIFQAFYALHANSPEKDGKPETVTSTVTVSNGDLTGSYYLVCEGSRIKLEGSASGGTGGYTHEWEIIGAPSSSSAYNIGDTYTGNELIIEPDAESSTNYEIQYVATDGNGDSSAPVTVEFRVTNSACGFVGDDNSPTMDCPSNHDVTNCRLDDYTTSGGNSLSFDIRSTIFSAKKISDITITQSLPAGTIISSPTNVTIDINDGNGGLNSCTFIVTPTGTDTTDPVVSVCPPNTTITSGTALGDYSGLVNASDNCDDNLEITQNPAVGTVLAMGAHTISLTVEDDAGNSDVCNFTLTVNASGGGDTTPPVIDKCPADQELTAGAGCGGATLPKYLPDNADISDDTDTDAQLTITQSPVEGTQLLAGTYIIFITVTDQAGNFSNCDFEVMVKNEEARDIDGDDIACENQILEYSLKTPNRVGSTYAWSVTNGTITELSNGNQTVKIQWGTNGTGTLTVQETTAGSCGSTTLSNDITITINALTKPTVTGDLNINCPTATGNYQINSPQSGHTYEWEVLDTDYANTTSYTGDDVNIVWKKEGQVSIQIDDNYPSGCSTTEYMTVTLDADTEKPQYASNSCPSNITRVVGTGFSSVIVTWTEPTFVDNCTSTSSINVSKSHHSGDSFPIGTTTVRYDISDGASNFITCTFDVIIQDTEKPILTNCPTLPYTKSVAVCTDMAVDYSAQLPTYSDNSGAVTVIPDPTHPSGATFEVGKTTSVTYRYEDASGNFELCTFDIFVKENVAPTFTSCPSNMTITPDTGKNYATLNYAQPQASDNCGTVNLKILTPAYASGQQITLDADGTKSIQVEYEVEDPSGNKASSNCIFNINIGDTEPPVISLPSGLPTNKIMVVEAESCKPLVFYTVTASDNHQIDKLIQLEGIASGFPFPLGFKTVKYKAFDMAGNTTTEEFYVQVVDNSVPDVPNLVDVKADAEIGKCSASVSWTLPTITDNCGGNITATRTDSNLFLDSGSEFPVGITEIKYRFEDERSNQIEKGFNVIVSDKQAPEFTKCPSNIFVDASADCDASVDFDIEISDNCTGATLTQIKGFPSGSIFPFGETEVEFSAEDASGNFATCTFIVTVEDKIAPFMSVPDNIEINANANSCTTEVRYTFPKTSDNCPNFITAVEIISGVGAGQVFPNNTLNVTAEFPVGITNQVFKVKDEAGNETTNSFSVLVNDGETPSFTSCPNDIIVPTASADGNCGTIVTYDLPEGSDNCESTVEFVTGFASGEEFPAGTTRVEYLITDAVGNGIICGFNVSVIDSIAPEITCPENVFITTDTGKCNAIYKYNFPKATDNCGKPSVSLKSGIGSGNVFPLGENEEIIQAIDASGNTTECSFTVTVVDMQAPVLECADDISIQSSPTICGAIVNYQEPVVEENCKNVSVKMLEGLPSGSTFSVGFTTVTYEAIDENDLATTCTFYVEVIDDIAPEVTCPPDIVVDNETGLNGATVNYPYFQIQDGCQSGFPEPELVEGDSSGSFFEIGEHLVRYKIADADGNFTTCTFKVIVENAVQFEFKQPKAVCFPASVDITDSTLVTGSTPNSVFEYYASAEEAQEGITQLERPDSLFSGLYYLKIISPLGATEITEVQVHTDLTPDTTLIVSDPVFCSGGVAEVEITGAEKDVIYQLIDDETGTLVGSQVEGDGIKAILEITPDTATIYRVSAITKFAQCYEELTDQANVTFDSRLSGDLRVTGGTICGGGEVEVKVYTTDPNVDYQLRFDADSAEVSDIIAGNGEIITFSVKPSETTTYHVYAILRDIGCDGILANKPTVTVVSQNNGFVTVGDPKICRNQTGEIILENTDATLNYSLYIENQASNILQSKSGTGENLTFSVSPARNTTYAIRVSADALNCEYDLLDKAQVTVLQPLTNNTINSSQTVCVGVEPQLISGSFPTGGDGAPSYYWEQSENGKIWKPARGDNRKPDYQPKGLINTTYFRRIVLTENCTDNVSDPIEIKVTPAPQGGDLSGSSTVFRAQNKGRLVLSGHSGEIIKWQFSNDRFADNIQELDIKTNSYNFLNLTKTTWFRVVIRNEICGEVYSDTAQVLVTDKPVINNNPIAVNDLVSTEKGQSVTANALENDSDPNADILIIKTLAIQNPVNGEVILQSDGSFTYTPKVDYIGLDSFQYEVCDDRIDSTLCANAWVIISIETDDSDGDGIPNSVEKGNDFLNPRDSDGDGDPDYLDLDSDGDGIPDQIEAGQTPRAPVNTDGDDLPDYLDLDSDNDLILDKYEGWIDPTNPPDTDGDGALNFRDLDSDNDGIPDEYEGDGATGASPTDTDNDGIPDYMDLDSDGDKRPDSQESGEDPTNPQDRNQNGIPEFREPFQSLKVYNIFTPNGDGDNDIWHIDGITEYENNTVRIFERDGMILFEIKNYDNIDNVWRGESNLTNLGELPEGTYFYQIDLGNEGIKKGFVLLKRER